MDGVRVVRRWKLFVCMRGRGPGGLRRRWVVGRGCEMGDLGYRLDTGVVFHIFLSDNSRGTGKEKRKGKEDLETMGLHMDKGKRKQKGGFGRLVSAFEALIVAVFLSLLHTCLFITVALRQKENGCECCVRKSVLNEMCNI